MNLKESTELLEHQEIAVDFFTKNKYVLCGDDMGLGKTLESLAYAIRNANPLDQILIISPAFLKYNWESEFAKFTDNVCVKVVNGLKDLPEAYLSDVIICNYARLEMIAGLFAKATYVIADEAHYLKNLDAKRTKLFHDYIEMYSPESLLLLTGTPVKNRVLDFYSLLALLDKNENAKRITDYYTSPEQFARAFSHEEIIQFKQWSPEWKKKVNVKKSVFKGLKNEETLRTFFKNKYIRRETHQVITLPKMSERNVMVNYKSKDSKLKSIWEMYRATPNKELEGELQTLKSKSALAKAPFSADIAKNYYNETGRQVVIFSDHVDATTLIAEKLKVPFITGSTPIKERQTIINKFVNGTIPYFVATIGSASTGINLVNADHLIFNDLNYTPAENAQARKRIHRIGQERDVQITYVVGSVIDEKITNNLREKEEVIKKIV